MEKLGGRKKSSEERSFAESLRQIQAERMIRIHVQICGECLTIASNDEMTVEQLATKSVEKLKKLKPHLLAKNNEGQKERVDEIRKTVGGSLLDPDDNVVDVLKDGEFVLIVMTSDVQIGFRNHSTAHMESEEMCTTDDHYTLKPEDQISDFPDREHLLILDGRSLTTGDLVKCGRKDTRVQLSIDAKQAVIQAREFLDDIVNKNEVVYGVTTGFGNFANVTISKEKLFQLQENLIRSHACGVGQPLPPNRVRMMLALRINVIAKGHSGVSLENVNKMIAAFNAFCVSMVPEQGTVGCSGDLAPSAHLTLGLLGEGRMWSPKTGWEEAAKVLAKNGLTPLKLNPKEGISLINGTQLVTAIGSEAVERADAIARQADVIAALTLDVLKGTSKAYDPDIHRLRPHKGQIVTAERLRSLLHTDACPSMIAESHRFCNKVQDAYTLRCVPQVHGIVSDTIEFVRNILTIELNSATDNPLVFANRGEILSGGNFHGEYPAKALDFLAIAVHELSQISERRLERLMNSHLSGLPAFLAKDGGLNSGFMMVQVTAASLVSENKGLCHPASVDSIPTSCNQEDHVSMGGYAARKALKVVEHVEKVLAMELLAACQGMEFLKPLKSTAPLQKVYELVRSVSKAIDQDRYMSPEIDAVVKILQEEKVWECVKADLEAASHMEELDPMAIRQQTTGSPTGFSLSTSTSRCQSPTAGGQNIEFKEPNPKKQKTQ